MNTAALRCEGSLNFNALSEPESHLKGLDRFIGEQMREGVSRSGRAALLVGNRVEA